MGANTSKNGGVGERKAALAAQGKKETAISKSASGAALLILLLAAAMPIAVANSTEFRAKVMQLLVRIDQSRNEAHFSYVEVKGLLFKFQKAGQDRISPQSSLKE